MKTKLVDALRSAFPRFLLGVAGIWCSLGPIILLNGSGSASRGLMTVLSLLLLFCYAVVFVICLRARWYVLKRLVSETTFALCFMISGLLINEMTGIFVAIKHKLVILYALLGFVLAEIIRPRLLIKAIRAFEREQNADVIETGTDGERSGKHSSAALETCQSATQPATKIQSHNQRSSFENQHAEDELKKLGLEINTSENLLRELTRRNQEVSDRCERLETDLAGLKRKLKDGGTEPQDTEAARQQLTWVKHREMIDKQRQEYWDTFIVKLEGEGKKLVQVLDETRRRLREVEHRCHELAEENCRLWEKVAVWQECLAVSAETQRQVIALWQQIRELQTEQIRLINGDRRGREEIVADREPITVPRLPSDFKGATEIAIPRTKSLDNGLQDDYGSPSHLNDSVAAIQLDNEAKPKTVWTLIEPQWSFAVVAGIVVMIVAVVATALLESKPALKAAAVAPETSFQEYKAEVVSIPQRKTAPRLRGTFETVRPTQVYDGPSENSALIADIDRGTRLNVVGSSHGWLEVRSRHGRPPGFIRQEAAVRLPGTDGGGA